MELFKRVMLSLRQYKACDAEIIEKWLRDEDVFNKWGGHLFGEYPINAKIIDDKYRLHNGDCKEADNFYPWVVFDETGKVVGHFIMRYLNGDRRLLRFGWVIVDDTVRGKGYGSQMLTLGLKYAFEILGVDKVTLGVYENNDQAHRCYQKVGFRDRELKPAEPWKVIEMEIEREAYLRHDV